MLGKQQQLDRIKKGDQKIKRMVKNNQMGAELDKLVLQVIKWEELYEKRFGRDPNAQLR